MATHVLEEANRCLQCKNPRCRQGCPIHTNIPEMIRLFKEDRMLEAAYLLFDNNPLSIVCSLVCNTERQCEGSCVRGIKSNPIHISAIEHYISDACFERIAIEKAPDNGKKVGVIGAGPAGMTIAVILASRGYKVTIFEGRDKMGGIMRYGIPDFRLPHSILDRYEKKLKGLGVYFRPNFAIGQSTSIQDLFDDGYKAVFVGTGAWRPRRLRIPGETFGNAHFAINYLNNPESVDLGNTVVIIGAGNSAMDVARTAIRQGARDVTIYVRRNRVSASRDEAEYAQLDGAKFVFQKAPLEILDDGVMFADTELTEDGKVKILRETAEKVSCDTVIIAASQVPQDRLVSRDKALRLNERGTLATDAEGETTMPGVFASGDVVTGARTVVDAVAESKRIADAMDRYIQSLG